MTWPDGFFVSHDHDTLGRMIAVRENGAGSGVGVLAAYLYDDMGRRTSTLHGNGTVTTFGGACPRGGRRPNPGNAVSRLASLAHDLAGTGQDYGVGFEHSPASQIAMRDQANGIYDWTPPALGTVAASHNDLDQVTASAGTSISHDPNGNLATWGAWSFDGACPRGGRRPSPGNTENRLKQVTGPVAMTLAYDPLGRLAQTVSGATTQFLYDGSDLVAEYDGAGNLLRRYVHGPGIDEPLVWYEGTGTSARRWLHADERGSVVAMSSATGASLATWRYGPHGESTDPAFTRFRYTGQLDLPGTPLHHFKARAYAPDLGRFLQPDPIGQAGGLNLYSYAGNDPVNFTDPSGLASCEKQGDCPTNSKDGFKDDPVGGGPSKGFSQGAFTMVFAGIDPPEPAGRFFPDPFAGIVAPDTDNAGSAGQSSTATENALRGVTCPSLISGPAGVSCGRGPNTTRFFASGQGARLAPVVAALVNAVSLGFDNNTPRSISILPGGNSPIVNGITGFVGLNRGGAFGLDPAAVAGATAIVVLLPRSTDDSPISRGADIFIRGALLASLQNKGLPVFLRAPGGRPGSILAVEFTGLDNGFITGRVSQESFGR